MYNLLIGGGSIGVGKHKILTFMTQKIWRGNHYT